MLIVPTILMGDVTGSFEGLRSTYGWLGQAVRHGIEEAAHPLAHQDEAADDEDRDQRHDGAYSTALAPPSSLSKVIGLRPSDAAVPTRPM